MLEFSGKRGDTFGHSARIRERIREHEKPGALAGWGGVDEDPMKKSTKGNGNKPKVVQLCRETSQILRDQVKNGKTNHPITRIETPREIWIKYFGNIMKVRVVGINIGHKLIFIDTSEVDKRHTFPAPKWMLQDSTEWTRLKAVTQNTATS
ncbi:hypothetical protein COU54_04155 [Candidatus Pacearchaeota archaeon CG10_big_fil_rev_8_21_14_0_10_31_24]|nr:MAG: hypothetical protein COU54_04155 [Candidatus Pacearchaeota archaeon CG10_big_fil_rev_8_21_14_0_10_31_24]